MQVTASFSFHGSEVRTVILPNGEPGFVGKDVAERLGYKDTVNAIKQHCKGVVIHHPILDALGRMQQTRVLTEPDVLRLIISSTLPAAQEFERWVFEEVLPSIRKTGSYATKSVSPVAVPPEAAAVMFAEAVNRALRLEGSAALGMVRSAIALKAPEYLPLLPSYAVDAPPSEVNTAGSSRTTTSMLQLLRDECARLGVTKKANTKMVSGVYHALQGVGIVEQRTRDSTSSLTGKAQFWSITEKGLEYGKNLISEKNPRETQPHWYVDRARDMLDLVLPKEG